MESTGSTINVDAMGREVIVGVTLGGALGDKFALGGSVSVNVVLNEITAEVTDDSILTASGDIGIAADDSTTVVVVAGGFAGSKTAAVGISASTIYEQNQVSAIVDGSEVTSTGGKVNVAAGMAPPDTAADLSKITLGTSGIELPDINSSQIINVTVGGAGSTGQFAGGFGVSVNIINNTIDAEIRNSSNVDAYSDVAVSAIDSSTIDAIAVGAAGANGVAIGGAASANVIMNTITAKIDESTVSSDGDIAVQAQSAEIIRALAVGASGAGNVAVGVSALGNAVADNITALISNSAVTAGGDVFVSAMEHAPSILPNWMLSSEQEADLDDKLEGTPVDLNASILAINVSVAGSGTVAVSAALTGNVVTNSIVADISDSTVKAGVDSDGYMTNVDGDVYVSSLSDTGIIAVTVGVGAAGTVGIQATAFGNIITNRIEATIDGGSIVSTGGLVDLSATDASHINSVGLSIAASGTAAVSAILGANVITNTVLAEIAGSTVKVGTTLDVDAENTSAIFGFAGGVAASGGAAVQVTLAGNAVSNTTKALISNEDVFDANDVLTGSIKSDVDAGGDITLVAKDTSSIDSWSVGVSGSGGVVVGVAMSVNAVANTIEAAVTGSPDYDSVVTTVDTAGSLSLDAESSSVIRSLGVGVAASGTVAVQVTAMGNAVANDVTSQISDAAVITGGDVTVLARDTAPSLIPDWKASPEVTLNTSLAMVDIGNDTITVGKTRWRTGDTVIYDNGGGTDIGGLTSGTTYYVIAVDNDLTKIKLATSAENAEKGIAINLTGIGAVTSQKLINKTLGGDQDLSGNILALNASVAASGTVAVNAVLTGNVIANDVLATIDDSTVDAGGFVDLDAQSKASILALTAGVAGSGAAAVNATGYGNVITNSVEASIKGDSDVTADGYVDLSATDESAIRSLGISVAGSGAVAVGALIGANVITNSVVAEISGSTVDAGATLDLNAESNADILGLTVGVAASGIGSGLFSLSANVITNTTEASINDKTFDEDGKVVEDITMESNVTAGGDVNLWAKDTSTINALAFGVSASGGGAIGVALAVNVIANTIETSIEGSTLETAGTLGLDSESSSIIRALAVGVSGSGGFAVQVTALGNVVANNVTATIDDSFVAAEGDVTISASDIAPSLIPFMDAVGDKAPDDDAGDDNETTKDKLEDALDGSPLTDLNGNILAVMLSVAGSGGVAVNVGLSGNVVTNTVQATIGDSTVLTGATHSGTYDAMVLDTSDFEITETDADLRLTTLSKAGITAFTVGVAASGAVAVNATGFGNVITNTTKAEIGSGSEVEAGGFVDLTAIDQSSIRSLGITVAASTVGLGALVGANVITNTVETGISQSAVTSGSTLNMSATSDAAILGFTAGMAAGAGAGLLSLSANVITDTTASLISAGSDIDVTGAVTLSAKDTSSIDALAFGVSFGGGAVGAALSANVIANEIATGVSGSTLDAGGTVSMTSESSSIIRAVSLAASAGGFAVQVSVLGNAIDNDVTSTIYGSTVTAGGDITLTAKDVAPSTFADWIVPDDLQDDLTDALEDSPIGDLSTANILALMISASGAGTTAVNVGLSGNVIHNTIEADIFNSTVRAGVNAGGVITNPNADIALTTLSDATIIALTAGVGVSGGTAVNFIGFGNVITNTVESLIEGGSSVYAGGEVTLSATDQSSISSVGLGIAGSGTAAISGIVGYDRIANTVKSNISGSKVVSGKTQRLTAHSDADIFSFAGGVAVSGIAAGQLSLAVNYIKNMIEASIADVDGPLSIDAGGSVILSADDTSTIDSISIGLAAAGGGAAGAAVSKNFIGNTVLAEIAGSMVESDSLVSVMASTSPVIRSFAAGVAAALGLAGNASVTKNEIRNKTKARIDGSIITASDAVEVSAKDTKPDLGNYLDEMPLPLDVIEDLAELLTDVDIDPSASILSFAGSIGGAGLASGSVAISDNDIANEVIAEVVDASTTSTGSGISITTDSDAKIVSLAAGVGAAGGVALNASATTNTINSDIISRVTQNANGKSTISAAGAVKIEAKDAAQVDSVALSLSGALGGAFGAAVTDNKITDNTLAYVAGTDSSHKVSLEKASSISINAENDASMTGVSMGATAGIVAAGASIAHATLTGFTSAYVGDYVDIGQTAGKIVGSLSVSADADGTVKSEADAMSGGIAAGAGADAMATASPTVIATLGEGSPVTVSGSVSFLATATPQATAIADGVSGGALSVGESRAQGIAAPTVKAFLDSGSTVMAEQGSVTVSAAVTGLTADAQAQASGGSALVTVNGAKADATASPVVDVFIGSGMTVQAGQDVKIISASGGFTNAAAEGLSVSFTAAVGVNRANAIVDDAETQAYVDTGTYISAGNDITISATSSQNSSADAAATAGAVVGVASTEATATRIDPVLAKAGDQTVLAAGHDVSITAENATTQVYAKATNIAGGVAGLGFPTSTATIADSTAAVLGNGATVTAAAGSFTIQAVTHDIGVKSESEATAYAGIAVASGDADTNISDPATVQVGSGSQITSGMNILVESIEDFSGSSTADVTAGGLGASTKAKADLTGTLGAFIDIGSDASLIAGATLQLNALIAQAGADVLATTDASGVGVGANSQANIDLDIDATVTGYYVSLDAPRVEVTAANCGLDNYAHSNAIAKAAGVDITSTAYNYVDKTAKIDLAGLIVTRDLWFTADTLGDTRADADADWDYGTFSSGQLTYGEETHVNRTTQILTTLTVSCSVDHGLNLKIDPNGNITGEGIPFHLDPDTGNIVVDSFSYNSPLQPQAWFIVNGPEQIDNWVAGNISFFNYGAYEAHILNESDRTLDLNAIYAPPADNPEWNVRVESPHEENLSSTQDTAKTWPNLLDVQSGGDIRLNGQIDMPNLAAPGEHKQRG